MMSSKRPVVILSERLGGVGPEELRVEAAGGELRPAPLWNHREILANAADARVILLGAVEPFDTDALESLGRLEVIVRRGVGHDNVDVDAATRLGILVANVPDASVEEVSDHALALLLAVERQIIPLDRAVHDGLWQRDPSRITAVRAGIRRLSDLTLGVVGFGRIGRALAAKAAVIYRRTIVADPLLDAAGAEASGVTLLPLEELLGEADHISLHAPHLRGTHHLINPATISRVRKGAVIVNTSRGGLVAESALIDGVRDGQIRAALDVSEREPLPDGDPLLGVEGIVLTAHSAASSETAGRELGRRSVDAVIDVLQGRLPASVVNPEVLTAESSRVRNLRGRS